MWVFKQLTSLRVTKNKMLLLKYVVLCSVVDAGKKGRKKLIEKPNNSVNDLNDILYPATKLTELANAGVDVSKLPIAQLFEDNSDMVCF